MQNEIFERLALFPFGGVPSERQIAHLRDYSKKAFFHFGVNTFTDLEWGKGEESERIFAPSETNVRQWIAAIAAAGFTFAILTAKHHDGFCLWPSAYTEHSVKNSPYKDGKGDVVREFTDACREFGIRCGIYLSPWDRNAPGWGTDAYSIFYNNQLTEILTNYGRIDEIWWDCAGSTETRYDWGLWAHSVRNLQPQAVIFGARGATPYVECRWVGNEGGYAGDTHYPTIPASALETENTDLLNTGTADGERFVPAEVDVSIRPGWFYHKEQDAQVRTVPQLVDLWFKSIGRGAMMLLNFPPDRRGLLHETDVANAIRAEEIIRRTFAFNLAAYATEIVSDSVRDAACSPAQLVNGCYDTFYAASEENITPTIELSFAAPIEFDTFSLGEVLELGVRVRGFRIEAFVSGEWVVLSDKKSMGFLRAEHFDRVKTDRVRLVIYDAAAAPVIRTLGLYRLPDDYYGQSKSERETIQSALDLASLPTARVLPDEKGVTVSFGGIYPFNTVTFCGRGIWRYQIQIFDGTNFRTVYEGVKPTEQETVTLDKTYDASYQMRLVTNTPNNENRDIRIFEL